MICIERALASAIFVAVLCFHVQISSAFVPSSFKAVRTDRTGGQVRNWVHGSSLPTLDIGDNAERDAKTIIYSGRQPSPPAQHVVLPIEEAVPATMPSAIRRFFLGKDVGPLLVVASISYFIKSRLYLDAISPLGSADGAAFLLICILWWFQEHFLHGRLLHSQFDWLGKQIHQEHHERDYFHVSIDPSLLIMSWLGVAHLIFRAVLPLHLALTVTIGYAISGLFYEWSHYIAHTRVTPKRGSLLAKIRSNHMRHHLVNPDYWLAFSVPSIDNIFGTNPTVAEAKKKRKFSQER